MTADLLTIRTHSKERHETLALTVNQNLTRWSGMFGKEVTPLHAQVFIDSLKGMAPDVVDAAMRRVEETFVPTAACPFPVPAHVRQILVKVNDNEKTIEAESAWQKALDWSRHKWHPDLRNSNLPALPHKI